MARVSARLLLILAICGAVILTPMTSFAGPWGPECLYPSPNDRFGFTSGQEVSSFGPEVLGAGGYLNWGAINDPEHPGNLIYYPMAHTAENGYSPTGAQLASVVNAVPGSLWVIGNESGTVWMDNTSPEKYAEHFHDIVAEIKSIDPTARFAFGGTATVTTLRLAWLERAWNAYRNLYGTDMPVDVWNAHTYIVNEMHNEWGAEIPAGIPNAVGYSPGQWTQVNDSGASGGTVHRSNQGGATAYFAFHGSQVTLYLRTGPDSGIAEVAVDPNLWINGQPVGQFAPPVDLYAPTPGTRTVTFNNLVPPGGVRGDRHNVRVVVTGSKNGASSGTWIRVDAVSAPSTASLPGGRFQDNDPLQAKIVTDINNHDNLDMIEEQIRTFRQWMADHGQRNKPLINTEYGILMTEDLGFDEPRVRQFLNQSFDRFLNDWTDPNLGHPQDGNRLLQQLFWFSLSLDNFEGRIVHTGLFDPTTGLIKPLGQDYAAIVAPLKLNHADLELAWLAINPTWPLFAGQPSRIEVEATVRNWGNTASGPFTTRAGSDGTTVTTWSIPNLTGRFDGNDIAQLAYEWQTVITGNRTIAVTADNTAQVNDPCRANNRRTVVLEAPPYTDLAIENLVSTPEVVPVVPPGSTTNLSFSFDMRNLGSQGTSASQIVVKLWHGDPDNGGVPIFTETILPGSANPPLTFNVDWPDRGPGIYEMVAEVVPVPGEPNIENNRQTLTVLVPSHAMYLPISQTGRSVTAAPEAAVVSKSAEALRHMIPAKR